MGRSFRQSRDEGESMRAIQEPFVRLGEIAIEDIAIDPVCRDDIPAVLRGIQHLYCDEALRRQVFDLLDAHFLPGVDRGLGRPGMDLWRIFVLATLKQGIRCDYDRLQDLANCHGTVREMLGHSGLDDHRRYEHRTLVRNVSLLTPELLNEINQLVVKAGHALFGQEPEARHATGWRPDLEVVLIADGACDNGTFFSEAFPETTEILDSWHAAQHLKNALDSAYGEHSPEAQRRSETLRQRLRDEENGIDQVLCSLRHLAKTYPKRKTISRVLKFFRKHRLRMRYAEFQTRKLPIGSGIVEAANRVLVAERMKCSGMRWKQNGAG